MQKCKVTIIEDDEITSMNLQLSLEKQGYEVISTFDNTDEALQNISKNLPDIFFIDISLNADSDGIQLAKEINAHYNLPFIYLTSHASDDIIEEAKQTKPYGYIVKPFHPNSLHPAIQMALFRYHSENGTQATQQQVINEISTFDGEPFVSATIKFGGTYEFRLNSNELLYCDGKLTLKDVENTFFKLLVTNLGVVMTFEEITKYILEETGENVSVRTLVWRLRNKLSTDLIKNAQGIGYYIEA